MTKKILFLGDNSVGITTLIKLFVTGIYTENNEKRIENNIIIDPNKFGINHYNYNIELIDGSSLNSKDSLINLIEQAQVIVFVYDFSNMKTLDKIQSEFLSYNLYFKNCYDFIIVGNKIDLLDENTQYNIIDQDKNILKKNFHDLKINFIYEYISCKKLFNIMSLFFSIISSLVYPFKPLLNAENNINKSGIINNYLEKLDEYTNTPFQFINNSTRQALVRVFRLLNSSCENFGIISKKEFMKIHKDIFGKNLDDENLSNISDFINDNIKLYINSYYNLDKNNGLENENHNVNSNNFDNNFYKDLIKSGKIKRINFDEGINEEEFINLNNLSILIQENTIVWNFLRKFSYGDNMKIDYSTNYNFFKLEKNKLDDEKKTYICELSRDAINLLTNLFRNYGTSNVCNKNISSKKNLNGKILSSTKDLNMENIFIGEEEWNNIFYPYITSNNFSEFNSLFSTNYNKERIITYDQWILFWQSLVRINYELAYEAFLYIGHHIEIKKFVKIIEKNKKDIFQTMSNKALKICVLAENNENLVIYLKIKYFFKVEFFKIFDSSLILKERSNLSYVINKSTDNRNIYIVK